MSVMVVSTETMFFCVCVQGYNNLLRDIFEDAGFLKSQKVKIKLPEVAAASTDTHNSLQKCTEVCIFLYSSK